MSKKFKIAAALIAGDSVKEDSTDFERCLRSLNGYVDRVFVSYNGSGEFPPQVTGAPPITYQYYAWEDDFSVNRNHSFQMVRNWEGLTGEIFDWTIWLDTDDTLEGGENLQSMLNGVDSETQGIFLRYDYAVDPDTGFVLAVQQRERLFRRDARAVWHYPIHEICHCPAGTQYARRDEVSIRHWRQAEFENNATRERNRRILVKARRENPEEPRFLYYHANEVYAEAALAHHNGEPVDALADAAIHEYEQYIDVAPTPDDAYMAAHQIAELKRMKGDNVDAIESELQAMMIHPSWPDAYVGIAQAYMQEQDWVNVEHWAKACLLLSSDQETTQVREPLNDKYLPNLLLGIARENQGNLRGALEVYEEMAEFNLTEEVDKKIEEVKEKIRNEKVVESFGDPSEEITDRKMYFGMSNKKSIAFFTQPLFEPWHPEIVKEGGIGGAETCVIEVAKRFAADDWRVVVFGTPGDHIGLDNDGVEWYESNDFLATEPFDVFVSSRSSQVFDANINAKRKYLWMHDVNIGDQFDGPFGPRVVPGRVDKILGLTNWHCKHLSRLYDLSIDYFERVPNGVDLSRFDGTETRQKNRFIWSSSPDRGLDVLLGLWPEIRKRRPDAELHVFYGWAGIDKIIKLMPDHYLRRFKEEIVESVEALGGEDGGIFWHDRVDQKTLAREMMKSDAWLYPTFFMETFCITAVEMQAAGCTPITSNVAALGETNMYGGISGWPNNFTFSNQYLDYMDEMLDGNSHREMIKKFAERFTWDNAYNDYWKPLVSE